MLLVSWYFIMYLYSIIGNLGFATGFLGILLTVGFGVGGGIAAMENERFPTVSKWACSIGLFLLLICALLPSKHDILLIVAGGAVGEFVSSNKEAQALPGDVTRWLHTELKAATDDISPVVRKKKEELEGLDKETLVKKLLTASDSIK